MHIPKRSNQLDVGLSVQDLVVWIESLEDTSESHSQNIIKFNDAIYDLIQYENESSDLLLTKLQSSSNRWILWGAIWVLSATRIADAIEPIWSIYKKTHDLGIEHYCLEALSILGDERVLQVAEDLTIQGRNSLCISILNNLGDKKGLYLLEQLLRDANFLIQEAVRLHETISKYDEFNTMLPEAKVKLREKLMIIQALSRIGGEESIKLLSNIIEEDHVYVQQLSKAHRLKVNAIYALSRIDHPKVKPILERAKTHKQYGIRNASRKLSKQM